MRLLKALLATFLIGFSATAENIYIHNVTVLLNDGKALENVTVAVSDDRIVSVGGPNETVRFRHLDLQIDGTGKFLIPGLAEMHGHLPYSSWDEARTEETLFLYLAGGVTTVRGMLGDPVQFELREKINAGEIAGPTLYLAAPSLNGNSVGSVEEAIAKTTRNAEEGWDLQKLHGGLSLAEFDAIAETANAKGYPFAGHVSAEVGIERALEAGQISIEHMDGYLEWLDGGSHELTPDELQRAVDLTKGTGAWIVPTQALFNMFYAGGDVEAYTARPENRYMSKSMVNTWASQLAEVNKGVRPLVAKNRQSLLKAFADGGINIAMGSDAPQVFSVPGFSIWREVEIMRDAGLTAAQILDIGTAAAGRYFKDKDNFGTITAGARADLILLDADPRADIMNITKQAGVMAAGRWYSREMIDARLEEIAARHQD